MSLRVLEKGVGWRGVGVGDASGQRAIAGVRGGLGQNRAVDGEEGAGESYFQGRIRTIGWWGKYQMALRLKHLGSGGPLSAEADERSRWLAAGTAPRGSDMDHPYSVLLQGLQGLGGQLLWCQGGPGGRATLGVGECWEDSDRGLG